MKVYNESLLHRVKRLYTELFLVSLHKRIDSYHSFLHPDKHHEIGGILHGLIDEIVNEVSHNYSANDYKNMKFLDEGSSSSDNKSNKIKNHSTSIVSMTANGLSVYLQKKKAQENDLLMSAKLQRCVWDHVHSAHRFARLGDGNTAKLHADIACNAMKMLSHYMQTDEYSDFFTDIGDQLQSMGSGSTENGSSVI